MYTRQPIDSLSRVIAGSDSPGIVAEGIAVTPDGQEIGLIVFAKRDQLVSLEVYSYADAKPARLPTLDSIRSYDRAKNG